MAVPGPNQWTDPAIEAAFLPPIDDSPYDPLEMRATGGIAINDGSLGREVQFWTVSYDGVNINVTAALSGISGYTLPVADVLSVCLAFDSNMAVAIAYQKADGSYLYFYNGVHNAYETIFVADTSSCRVVVDKTTRFFEAQSDVIFIYVDSTNALKYRIQRDRYAIVYSAPGVPETDQVLVRFGPNSNNRLQAQLDLP